MKRTSISGLDADKEVWGVTQFDTRAHLYLPSGRGVRRLCHRSHFTSCDTDAADYYEQCKICLNIRGKIITRRHTKRLREGKKIGDPA